MKKLTYLFLMSLTSICYSQTIGITSAPHKLGAGIFYNSNELSNKISMYESFDYGWYHSPVDIDYNLIKGSAGIGYIVRYDKISRLKFLGAICYNDITPANPNVSIISAEIGILLYYNRLSYILAFDFVNQDVKIGIGFVL
jgi:hypothetical protein